MRSATIVNLAEFLAVLNEFAEEKEEEEVLLQKIRKILAVMPNGPWPSQEVTRIVVKAKKEYVMAECSPLFYAATNDQFNVVQEICKHFGTQSSTLENLFDVTFEALQTFHKYAPDDPQDQYSKSRLENAIALLLMSRPIYFPYANFKYTEEDKKMILNRLLNKVTAIASADALIKFFEEHIDKPYLRQHRGTFSRAYNGIFSTSNYTNTQLELIEMMQKCAVDFVDDADESEKTGMVDELNKSKLFDESHFKRGLQNKEPSNMLLRFQETAFARKALNKEYN